MEWLVAFDTHWISQLSEEFVDFIESVASRSRVSVTLHCCTIRKLYGLHHFIIIEAGSLACPWGVVAPQAHLYLLSIEQSDFRRFRKKSKPELFCISIERICSACIDPASHIGAGLEVLEVAENQIAQVLLKVLAA